MIKKYAKKPVTIEAVIWTGGNIEEINAFCGKDNLYHSHSMDLFIKTLEGNHLATFGDYIIKGVKNEFYPCKPDIFNLTYEEAKK